MKIRKPLLLNTAFILLGVLVATLWVYLTGGRTIVDSMLEVNPLWILLLLAITVYFIFMRFFRWQFMLRRVGVRVPVRPSLRIFLASLIGTATPAYIGEMLLRSIFMRGKFGIPFRVTAWVLALERILDVLALCFIGALTASITLNRWLMVAVLFGTAGLLVFAAFTARRWGVAESVIRDSLRGKTFLISLGFSFLVWIPTALMIFIAALSRDLWLSPFEAMHVFSYGTILGGLSLSPAGIGITGSAMILNLEKLNFNLQDSVTVVTLVRFAGTGFALSLGTILLAYEFFQYRQSKNIKLAFHFDEIATEYQNQFQEHVWNYLLARKSGFMASTIDTKLLGGGIGLDLGCGLGLQCQEMKKRGYTVFGMDMAYNLLAYAREAGADVVNGDALKLPFQDESLDYVYTIGVLHHLSGSDFQRKVCQEVQRVLKPGGVFIIHETNPRNPLFRFYMGYIFPILKSIDEGTEWWIEPNFWEQMRGLDLINMTYFTFMPDFVPEFLLNLFHRIEEWLENSALREYSVHYMAVVEKV